MFACCVCLAQQLYAPQSASTIRIGLILPVLCLGYNARQSRNKNSLLSKCSAKIKYRTLENIVISDNGDYCFEIVLLHLDSIDSSSFSLQCDFDYAFVIFETR